MLISEDRKYGFRYMFDDRTGFYMRTGILDSDGRDTGKDPFRASFPHLIDVGVMGHCIHGGIGLCIRSGVGCYQSGQLVHKPNMSAGDFERIAEQCEGRCNQFALGGRGDPDQHEDFEKLLKISRRHGIVPNFTTSGYGMTPELAGLCAEYCGAVAVSWYRSDYTYSAVKMLTDAGVRTNIHYVVGRNSIDEAVKRLENDDFPEGINAVVFLLHKPTGQGTADNVLSCDDPSVRAFFEQIPQEHRFKVGIDSCSVPGVVNMCAGIDPTYYDPCEGGRFSCYISSDMIMTPCSFDAGLHYGVSLRENSIEEAWNSSRFETFRNILNGACPSCVKRDACLGGCPLMPEIVLCGDHAGCT